MPCRKKMKLDYASAALAALMCQSSGRDGDEE
jgi:hypothetical protein